MPTYKEDCWRCGKVFDYRKKGSALLTVYAGLVKKTNFIDHNHIAYCPKCSKDLINFIKSLKHKLPIHI